MIFLRVLGHPSTSLSIVPNTLPHLEHDDVSGAVAHTIMNEGLRTLLRIAATHERLQTSRTGQLRELRVCMSESGQEVRRRHTVRRFTHITIEIP